MKLTELLSKFKNYKVFNLKDFNVKGISCDSRKIEPNFIFVAIKGSKQDGLQFIPQAIKKKAKAIILEKFPKYKNKDLTYIKVKNIRRFYAHLCSEFYQNPSRYLKVVGVTGTNGKTTITYLIENILKNVKKDSLVIGTIDYRYKNRIFSSHNTTPSCEEIQSLLWQAKRENVEYAIMEVSSHGLSQYRVEGIDFSYAIFTGLSQDHLDYHRTMNAYFNAKARLFKMLSKDAFAIINIDDHYAHRLIKLIKAKIVTYGLSRKADFSASQIHKDINGTDFILNSPKGKIKIYTPLLGKYNIYNILASCAFAVLDGIKLSEIRDAQKNFINPPGRLELVWKKDFYVFVDYAHTPVALKNVILTLREVFKGRLILVFGCGGNRDRKKRPIMGKIASNLADFVVVTSDNPRNEEPQRIIRDILKGIKSKNYKVIPDRKEALLFALSMVKPKDVILVAGKGHERYQIIKDKIIPFDDRLIIREYLNEPIRDS